MLRVREWWRPETVEREVAPYDAEGDHAEQRRRAAELTSDTADFGATRSCSSALWFARNGLDDYSSAPRA